MKLKTLEMTGFKSFADKTVISFEDGVTAFVGPNGCGKSNVVDSIKWVLGDSSPKSQRSQEMTDVIFNGTSERKALNYAEVKLTFSNVQGILPIELDEVEISRRMYRDGESHYFINKKACRRKDVRELFMDTGVGTSSYSIIEQGKIDQLISGNSDDRRLVLDEAAGINKYKAQRHQAILKLERAEAHLKVLQVSEDEIRRQYNSISRQAAEAKRYQRKNDRLKEVRLQQLLMEYQQWLDKKESINNRIEILRKSVEDHQIEITKAETAEAETQNKVQKATSEFMKAQENSNKHKAEIQKIEAEIKWLQTAFNDIIERISKDKSQQAEIAKNIDEINNNITQYQERLKIAKNAADKKTEALNAARKNTSKLKEQVEESRIEYQDLQLARLKHFEAKAEIETRFSSAKVGIATMKERVERLNERKTEALNQRRVYKDRLKVMDEQTKSLDEKKKLLVEKSNENLKDLNNNKNSLENLTAKKSDLERNISATRSKSETLKKIEEAERSKNTGATSLINSVDMGDTKGVALLGLVADIISPKDGYEKAIGAALGNTLQAVAVETEEDCERCRDFILKNKHSRTTFIPATWAERQAFKKPKLYNGYKSALDVLEKDSKDNNIAKALLIDVVVADNFSEAASLANEHPHLTVVSKDGDRFGKTITVGKSVGSEKILTRKSEIVKLDKNAKEFEEEIKEITSLIAKTNEQIIKLEETKSDFKIELGSLERHLKDSVFTRNGIIRELEKADELVKKVEEDYNSSLQKHKELEEQLSKATGELKDFAELPEEHADMLTAMGRRFRRKEVELRELEAEESELRIQHTQIIESFKTIENSINHSKSNKEELEKRAELSTNELESLEVKKKEIENQVQTLQEKLNVMIKDHDVYDKKVIEASNAKADIEATYVKVRNETAEKRQSQTVLTEQLNQGRLEEGALQGRIDACIQRSSELSDKDFEILYDEYKKLPEPPNKTALADEKIKLEESIRRIGSVNQKAIEEQEELRSRLLEKETQKNDVTKSRKKLYELITEINKHCLEKFTKTFTEVQEHFKTIFRKLFGGGRAELKLVSPDDILESGIEIAAKPPGKELRSISLLSGGEKALTCSALILAMYKAKPSPFCLFDEVDAPLDEHNIDRFMEIVKSFATDTQFVVISHSRRTMSLCDAVYGITMQEKGISSLFSTKIALNEIAAAN